MEGGDDGGVYVAAIQTLEGKRTGEEREKKTLQYSFYIDKRVTSLLNKTAETLEFLDSFLQRVTPTWTCRQMVALLFSLSLKEKVDINQQ